MGRSDKNWLKLNVPEPEPLPPMPEEQVQADIDRHRWASSRLTNMMLISAMGLSSVDHIKLPRLR